MHLSVWLTRTLLLILCTLPGGQGWAAAQSQGSAQTSYTAPVYGTGKWDESTLGNHRAVVQVMTPGDAAWAHLAWRRRDHHPEQKEIIVIDARTGSRVVNVVRSNITQESGDLVFQPVSGPGEYDIYFMPFRGDLKSNYPKMTYPEPTQTAEPSWLSKNSLRDLSPSALDLARFPSAATVNYQSRDDFNRFTSMEVIATRAEREALLGSQPSSSWFAFPEDRAHVIRMTDDLPVEWAHWEPGSAIVGTADKGEFYTFQLGLWAARRSVEKVRVTFAPLSLSRSAGHAEGTLNIPASALQCFKLGGIDAAGEPFTSVLNVTAGKVQALWCGIQIPPDAQAGDYSGHVDVSESQGETKQIGVHLTVTGHTARNSGDDDPYRMTRLRWLNSRLAIDDDIVAPYTPIKVSGSHLSILGRDIALAPNGLPASIKSAFTLEMTGVSTQHREILASPIHLDVEDQNGVALSFPASSVRFLKRSPGVVSWQTSSAAGSLRETLHGQLEFDGSIMYTIALTASQPVQVRDIHLEIPFAPGIARYAMGLGYKGGTAPASYDWKWDVSKNQDSAWLGDVNAGLQFSLRDNKYVRPLNTNFYHAQPLVMPESWENHGKGGCRLAPAPNQTYLAHCYSGPRLFAAGETQYYNLRLLITPFHTIHPELQFTRRYFHAYKPVSEAAATGANVINIHHATAINPFINYPFLRAPEMKSYVEQAHAAGMKVKIYYTVRELTNHAPELFALQSLNNEVLAKGSNGGAAWLQEHVSGSYLPGWHVPELDDSALVTTGMSRWLNFYVEGMRWLVENEHIDGLYLDDIAFDRLTMERIRKVLLRGNPGGLIDVHSANQFNPRDGYASSANLYLEQFPFIDRLWFGEYFDYDSSPDDWLVEISGIPYGLMGEMLQDGGNPWRGMIYGMTGRLPWAGDPRPLWAFWDRYKIQDCRMIGYWVPSSPVSTDKGDVLATSYLGHDHAIISIASWNKEQTTVRLKIDWKQLGILPAQAKIFAPRIENFQDATEFKVDEAIPVQPRKGWLLVIEKK